MITTIKRKVKGWKMEQLFDNSPNNFMIKYFRAINTAYSDYDPQKTYCYEIILRHNEDINIRYEFYNAIKDLTKKKDQFLLYPLPL